jgi:hypothetical protein
MAQEKDYGFPSLKKTITWAGLSTTRHCFCVLLNTLLELRMLYSKHARRLQWMKLWILQFHPVAMSPAERAALKRRQDEWVVKDNICFSTLMKALI